MSFIGQYWSGPESLWWLAGNSMEGDAGSAKYTHRGPAGAPLQRSPSGRRSPLDSVNQPSF
jgi:hypothetical protein